MRNRWDVSAARGLSPLNELVYRSRLIGEEPALGLFGGGNTSLKGALRDLAGATHDVLWVKGSGCDLKGCQPRHFAVLRLAELRRLTQRTAMTDDDMVAFLEQCLLDPKSPRPSIETLLHAFIPEAAIDHTHADAILALANHDQGEALVRRVLGPQVLWIPYLQPGFALSRRVYDAYRRQPAAHGAVLEQHGLITWGPSGAVSYGRTIALVSKAERLFAERRRRARPSAAAKPALPPEERMALLRSWLPVIRRTISGRKRMCLRYTGTPDVMAFVADRRLLQAARIGPATPDHMLRTKRLPLILNAPVSASASGVSRALERYAEAHRRYVATYGTGQSLVDPFPRVILIPQLGMLTSGHSAEDALKVAVIYRHAMAIMRDASLVGRYASVSAREAFNVEYWPLELYKLSLAPPEPELSRLVCVITGAAGGIGRAIAARMVQQGACVAVTDLHAASVKALAQELNASAKQLRAIGVAMDVTSERSIQRALDDVVRTFGGLDALVSNAGVAAVASIDRLSRSDWDRSLLVNATGHFLVARSVIRWLRAQRMGGTLVFIASKNVLAPGKDFGAYSAAKAAETQLARVLAIENGEVGIRVNIVNPDGVFDGSGLWKTIGPSRADSYGLKPGDLEDYYRRRNLMKVRVMPDDVADAVCFLASARAAKTTGCILTVDGGLREAFPR